MRWEQATRVDHYATIMARFDPYDAKEVKNAVLKMAEAFKQGYSVIHTQVYESEEPGCSSVTFILERLIRSEVNGCTTAADAKSGTEHRPLDPSEPWTVEYDFSPSPDMM